jgi:hypothetical protein
MKNENIDIQDNLEDYEMYIMHLRYLQIWDEFKEAQSESEIEDNSAK